MSSGLPSRPIGTARRKASRNFSGLPAPCMKLSSMAVSVRPGQTVFRRTPLVASSRASVLVMAMMPPLQAE
ncbi:hypothetical protein D3C83_205130 [compost metagenome]